MIGIYKITNNINGKCYIGQSINIKQRWKGHKKDAFWKDGPDYNYPLYQSMRKYGIENFSFEVLEECSKEELNEKEIAYILRYKAYGSGYNQTQGGNSATHPIKLQESIVDEIILRLKTTAETNTNLAKEFNVSECMIRMINNGECWVKDNEKYPIRTLRHRDESGKIIKKEQKTGKCLQCGKPIWPRSTMCHQCTNKHRVENRQTQRPSKVELAQMIINSSFEAVGKMFGISGNAIKKWCKCYEIPSTKEQLKQWYFDTVGQEYLQTKSKCDKRPYKRPVNMIDSVSGKTLKTFSSIKDAAESLDIHTKSHISDVCRGLRKSAYGYFWQYADVKNT